MEEIKEYLEILTYSGLYSLDRNQIERIIELKKIAKNNSFSLLENLLDKLYKNLIQEKMNVNPNYSNAIRLIAEINTYINISENKIILSKY